MEMDRTELQDAARRLLASAGLTPDPAKCWPLIVEAGWLGLAVPEALGGLGQGWPALGVLYAELGRVLAPAGFLASMLALQAICEAPAFAGRAAWLERVMAGEPVTASLSPGSRIAWTEADGGARLSGRIEAAAEADAARWLLISSDEVCALLSLDQPGIAREPRRRWDETRSLFDLRLEGARAEAVLARGPAAATLARILAVHLDLALAADGLGGADALLAMTVDYLQTRRQFGRPLAMFQALKHRCADLKAKLAAAEALFWRLAEGRGGSGLDALTEAGALKSHVGAVYGDVGEEAIQLHGGIAMTAEHPCHLFVKRALANTALGGEADHWEAAAGREAISRLARA
jgi:alkylation response protein AidB-like acyl-CoA dehydrogenase